MARLASIHYAKSLFIDGGQTMERLRDDHGFGTVDRALRFLSIRLRSRPETVELAAEIDAERPRFRQAEDMWLEARELRVAATAEVEYLDGRLDEDLMDLSRAALLEVKGKRDDARYKRLFSSAPSDAMRPVGGTEQERFVRAVLAQLTSESGPFPTLRERGVGIEATLTMLKAAETRRDDLYVPESTAATERTVALDRARRVYNLMHARLRLTFPEDERLVESFFAKLRAKKAPTRVETDEDAET